MSAVVIIERKRDKHELTKEEIEYFIKDFKKILENVRNKQLQ